MTPIAIVASNSPTSTDSCLQITVDSLAAFEKLIDAYGKIADMMPRIDRLASAVSDANFQNVLALVYADILEFHRRAYKFVRRKCERYTILHLIPSYLTLFSMGYLLWINVGSL